RVVLPRLVALGDLVQGARGLGRGVIGSEPVGVAATVSALDRVVLEAEPVLVAHGVETTAPSRGTTVAAMSPVVPGTISARRSVPASIVRPEYVDKEAPQR